MASSLRPPHPALLAALGVLAVAGLAAAAQRFGPIVLFGLVGAGVALLALDRPAFAAAGLLGLVVLLEADPDALVPGGEQLYAFVGPTITGVEVLLALAVGTSLLAAAARGRVALPEPFTLPLLLLVLGLVAGVVTGKAAGVATDAALQPVRQAAPVVLLPFVVVNVVPHLGSLRRWIGGLGALAVLKGVVGVAGVVSGAASVIAVGDGAAGTYLESTANLLTMVFLCVVAAAVLRGVPLPRWALWAAPIVLLCLALSYRRSFWIGTSVALLLVLLLGAGIVGRRLLVPGAVVIALAGWLLVGTGVGGQLDGSVAERAGSLDPTKVRTNDEDRYRLSERRNVLIELREHPVTGLGLGVGWAAERPMPTEHAGGRQYVHLAALWWWMKLGILGLLGYLALMATAVVTGVRVGRRHADPLVGVAALGLGCGVVGLAIAELTATFTGSEVRTSVLVGVLLGLLAAAHATQRERPTAA